jgi:hypothetical protein
MTEGWISISRKLTEWEWYSDANVTRLFLHLLLVANFTEGKWCGQTINRGQAIASREKIASQTGLSIKQIRTAENKLISSGSLAVEGANRFTRYTIVKYEEYQKHGTETANEWQSKGKPRANKGQQYNKNNKNNNEREESVLLPDWIPLDAWNGFVEMRNASRAKMTDRAKILAIEKLTQFRKMGYDVAAILNKSTINNWKDVYEPKQHSAAGTPSKPTKDERAKSAVVAGVQAFRDSLEAGH